MAADIFKLAGGWVTTPANGQVSGLAVFDTPLDESVVVKKKHYDTIELTNDAPVAVNFGGLANAHVVMLKAVGGRVNVDLTSSLGNAQHVAADPVWGNICLSLPYTAITLTRESGKNIVVDIFLGEKA